MKVIVIYNKDNLPVYVAKVEEVTPLDFVNLRKKCEENAFKDRQVQDWKEETVLKAIADIKKDIKELKGED